MHLRLRVLFATLFLILCLSMALLLQFGLVYSVYRCVKLGHRCVQYSPDVMA